MRLRTVAGCWLLIIGWLPLAPAREGEFQTIPRLGLGMLEIENADPKFGSGPLATFQFGVSFGYSTPIGLIAEAGVHWQDQIDVLGLFDRSKLTDWHCVR